MNVLILTEVFFPDTIGGAGKYAYQVSKALVDKGHKVFVLTRRVNNLGASEIIDGINLNRIGWSDIPRPLRLFSFWHENNKALKLLFQENHFDLIVFNQPFSAFTIIFSKQIKKIPKIYNFQSSWADEFEIKSFLKRNPFLPVVMLKRCLLFPAILLMRLIEKSVILKCVNILTLSQYMKNRLMHLYKVAENKIKIIPAGVDTNKFKPVDSRDKDKLRVELAIAKESFALFTARNLVPRMGLDNLIIAFSFLVKDMPNVKLLIAGAGFLENKLKNLVRRLNLSDKVKFLGPLSEEVLVKYYQASDLFVLPTEFLEGFGIATIEALACGIPVLGTPVGGTVEILGKFDREFMFSGAEAKQIYQKISDFIKTPQDRISLSKYCRNFIMENYSLEKFSESITRFYLSASKNEN